MAKLIINNGKYIHHANLALSYKCLSFSPSFFVLIWQLVAHIALEHAHAFSLVLHILD